MQGIKIPKWSKLVIFLFIFLFIILILLFLILFGLPSNTKPTIPPKSGLINLQKIELKVDIQSVLSYKLKDKGNAAVFYIKAFKDFDSSIILTPPSFYPNGQEAVYNRNYPGIELILQGAKYKECNFPIDIYYSANPGNITDPTTMAYDLAYATLTRGTALLAMGEQDKALEHFEALVVFGKHLNSAGLTYWSGNRGSYIMEDGLKQLKDYYSLKGDKRRIKICESLLLTVSTFGRERSDFFKGILSPIYKGSYFVFPNIRNFPYISVNAPSSEGIKPLIECALYHEDRSFRIFAIEGIGGKRNSVSQKFLGIPILDHAKQKEIDYVLQYIYSNDTDPLVRDMADLALKSKSQRIYFYP